MLNVTAHIDKSHYQTNLSNTRQTIIADEPATENGTDLGFSPNELLCSALASCTAITLRMYADRKQWDLQEAKVQVSFERDAQNVTHFKREVTLIGELTSEQRERLLGVANACPIHKVLTNPIEVATSLTA
ncbi:MAG: OsmC family peroxiredoxin [Bacteroidetes bacterium]|jgi:putative redox protein|nr:MAG: OsmC family peroxiredoxin [Bacteroidota bacterium]